jgi:hypothetical protein
VPSTQPQRPYNVRYYWAHRAEEIERVRRRQRATVEWLRDLRRVPCADCGKTYPPYVMDFDHRDPSTKSFSLLADKPLLKNREVLLAEVAKCDVVCANCHAERTWRQWATHDWGWPSGGKSDRIEYRRKRAKAQADLLDQLRDTPCHDCGGRFALYVMQFDHRDPTTKTHLVSQMIGHAGTARILAEVAKCDIVCANCHRQRSYVQRTMTATAGVAQLVEREFSKLDVAGSSPVSRSAAASQLRLIEEPYVAYRYAA